MFKKASEQPEFELFTVYDSKVGNYRDPIIAINKHDILRQIEMAFRQPSRSENQLFTNAEDFAVFKIGEYSRKTGVITPINHEHVSNLHDLRSMVTRDEKRNLEAIRERDQAMGQTAN